MVGWLVGWFGWLVGGLIGWLVGGLLLGSINSTKLNDESSHLRSSVMTRKLQ